MKSRFVTGCGAYLGIMVLIVYFYMPTFLQVQYGFARATVFNANAAALLMLAVMCPVWGWIADRIGAAVNGLCRDGLVNATPGALAGSPAGRVWLPE